MRERKKEPARASKTRNRKGHLLFWKWWAVVPGLCAASLLLQHMLLACFTDEIGLLQSFCLPSCSVRAVQSFFELFSSSSEMKQQSQTLEVLQVLEKRLLSRQRRQTALGKGGSQSPVPCSPQKAVADDQSNWADRSLVHRHDACYPPRLWGGGRSEGKWQAILDASVGIQVCCTNFTV